MSTPAPAPEWTAFKAHLLRTIGPEGAPAFLRYAADVMEREQRIRMAPIDAKAVVRAVRK